MLTTAARNADGLATPQFTDVTSQTTVYVLEVLATPTDAYLSRLHSLDSPEAPSRLLRRCCARSMRARIALG